MFPDVRGIAVPTQEVQLVRRLGQLAWSLTGIAADVEFPVLPLVILTLCPCSSHTGSHNYKEINNIERKARGHVKLSAAGV